MIKIIFEYLGEKVLVIIKGRELRFGNTAFGNQLASIEGLKLSYSGVCKEFPELKSRADWREEAIKRFKQKISKMGGEKEIANYIIEDLKKYGYKALFKQIQGFRTQKLKDGK